MELVAADEKLLCLRYKHLKQQAGVATTLVFTKSSDEPFEMGNCWDHLAISTRNVDAASTALCETSFEKVIFMEPSHMFGTKIMGLDDPSGYKVYLVEQQP
jgi:hypothetical protein